MNKRKKKNEEEEDEEEANADVLSMLHETGSIPVSMDNIY